VLEIGPGRGALTTHLAERSGRLLLIEFDHALAAWHRVQYQQKPHVTVIDADVLKVDLEALLPETPQKWNVVANLPYNISTEVLFRLYHVHERLARMTLMLQKEVGDRLVAPPDCSAYGVTTVLLGLWFDISRAFVVHPDSFHPSPKIDSVILNFIPRTEARAEVGDEEVFRAVVKSSFSMRRKTLYNCLKSAEFAKEIDCSELLEACSIEGRRRGETLSLEEFSVLSRWVTEKLRVIHRKANTAEEYCHDT
ncbi:MAG: 16S rRNA (adenine(1518)-N(6)/adenine(1519)-N(6))-dimethyltransferase RsmA, partial [Desulfuromonadales bacterium]